MVLHRLTIKILCAFALVAGAVPTSIHAESSEGESSMTVADGTMVSLEYTLTLEDQSVLEPMWEVTLSPLHKDLTKLFQVWNRRWKA